MVVLLLWLLIAGSSTVLIELIKLLALVGEFNNGMMYLAVFNQHITNSVLLLLGAIVVVAVVAGGGGWRE